jgi:hypothetical protein
MKASTGKVAGLEKELHSASAINQTDKGLYDLEKPYWNQLLICYR